MAGLRMIARLYGGIRVTQDGKTVEYVWDYERDRPVTREQLRQELRDRKAKKKADKAYFESLQGRLF